MINLAEVVTDAVKAAWDEELHPRHPEGSPDGGKFAPKGGGGWSASDDDEYKNRPGELAEAITLGKQGRTEAAVLRLEEYVNRPNVGNWGTVEQLMDLAQHVGTKTLHTATLFPRSKAPAAVSIISVLSGDHWRATAAVLDGADEYSSSFTTLGESFSGRTQRQAVLLAAAHTADMILKRRQQVAERSKAPATGASKKVMGPGRRLP